ncbi:GIY-YIG nuclease family protein [Streptomyces avidinii]|uniref:GIY-YIG nuclease family protein n=1 Tax=Streptomyces avidinii TaxID=1895 RepID=UPI003870CB75|nr:GIY-YIG nuclease family protein [Streptomyces avidinii]
MTALYRIFDAEDRLLYVGISGYPVTRLDAHRRGAPWRAEIARHAVEEFPTRQQAAFAESEAINIERPRYNKQGRRTEPQSVTLARQETVERNKIAAREGLARCREELAATEERFQLSLVNARKAGLSLRELASLSGRSTETVRKAIRINGDSRTRVEREVLA